MAHLALPSTSPVILRDEHRDAPRLPPVPDVLTMPAPLYAPFWHYGSFNDNAAHGTNLVFGNNFCVNDKITNLACGNFFGFTQDATVSMLFHYPLDTFAICSQLNRRTHSCLGGLRRQAIRLRISEPSLALWQPGPTGPGSPRAGALPR